MSIAAPASSAPTATFSATLTPTRAWLHASLNKDEAEGVHTLINYSAVHVDVHVSIYMLHPLSLDRI